MLTTITPEQRQAAKREIIRQIEQGVAAKLARIHSAVPMHRTTVYRLLKRVQHAIAERFGSAPSVSQLNRVRARLGLSRQPVPREKKASSRLLP